MSVRDLVALLQSAKEGSREVDTLIGETVFNLPVNGDDANMWGLKHVVLGGEVVEIGALSHIQRYSTSVDAALTLVPKGWSWHLRSFYRGSRPVPVSRAVVFNDRTGMVLSSEYCEAEAGTAPLALCIAALRARSGDACQ